MQIQVQIHIQIRIHITNSGHPNLEINSPYKLLCYFLSISISFPYFLSRLARNKGN